MKNELLEKRVIDMNGHELVELFKIAYKASMEKPEWVNREEKDIILGCNPGTEKSAKACKIARWGKEQRPAIIVRKRGASLWHREDLEALAIAYYSSK